ncbi:hypothetical protein FOA52_013214 [Chlamydomonas sp. UWO 241]|nr:hypothetical protein FOA52_013214 [Chlamydomonas sp. UWO 241]
MQHAATSNSNALLFCGSVAASQYGNFAALVPLLVEHEEEKRRKGAKGLQRNPSFIHSLITSVLAAAPDSNPADFVIPPAKGGFTDVGQHTGSAARDTCWPLVREVFQVLLIHGTHAMDPHVLFQLSMAHFELWLLSRQLLSRSSFLAQQMLLPLTDASHQEEWAKLTVSFASELDSHYDQQQASTYSSSIKQHSSTACAMNLVSKVKAPAASEVGASHIDSLLCPDDGIWHPDGLTIEMGWAGGNGVADKLDGIKPPGYFNPFATLPAATTELLFTEQLAPPGLPASPLQWVMHVRSSVDSTPADRGNMAIARQDLRPAWLSKPGFLALGSLRAFPLGQLRRLSEVLQLRELPWAQPEVVTIIRQTLYQLGTLVERKGAVQQLWRTDWVEGRGTLAALGSELEQLADKLAQTPRSHDDVLLLGEAAAFLSLWHAPCVRTARIFAAMPWRAADELDSSIAEAVGAAAQAQLQARQCKLRMLSLLCYGPGSLADADNAAAVLQLMVQVKHDHVCFVDMSEAEDTQLRVLHVRCHNVTARHAAALIKSIQHQGAPQLLLRDAAARVLGEERTPPKHQIIVLRPPNFRMHDTHFIVSITVKQQRSSASTTTSSGGATTASSSASSSTNNSSSGGGSDGSGVADRVEYQCWRVPPHARGVPWRELWHERQSQLTDLLLLAGSSVTATRVLSKFERPEFIHVYASRELTGHASAGVTARAVELVSLGGLIPAVAKGTCTLLWELPRYGLEFRQCSSGPLVSVSGYGGNAARYTLPEFSAYLVLERNAAERGSHNTAGARLPDVLVLVPRGLVVVGSRRQVQVQIPATSGRACELHAYELHVRFGHLQASSTLARLQLAALYAATSSRVPEPLSMAMGAQIALQLLRMCWSNKPLSSEEEAQLRSVAQLGGHHCAALRAMVHELLLSASQLSFLHDPLAEDGPQQALCLDADAGVAYVQERTQLLYKGWVGNPRSQLTDDEEIRALSGMRGVPQPPAIAFRAGLCQTVEVDPCPVNALVVSRTEAKISACLAEAMQPALPSYPLKVGVVPALAVTRDELACKVQEWQLCVLEDKLERLGALAITPAEMEPTLVRLNMGEGKTRVILPMLVMALADGQRRAGRSTKATANLLRLNFPSTLLHNAHKHMHRYLTASALGRKVLLMPFNRDVQITESGARTMLAALHHCQSVGGVVLVAPEHRASLHLEWHELHASGGKVVPSALWWCGGKHAELSALDHLSSLPLLDILDALDKLLHHRFQLIYAWGRRQLLPGLSERVAAVQALMRVVSARVDDPKSALRRPGVAVFDGPETRPHGGFSGVRLLQGEALDAATLALLDELASALIDDPPYECRWMAGEAHAKLRVRILKVMLDDTRDAEQLLGTDHDLSDDKVLQLLALRGMLAGRVLVQALQKRHLVDYGVNRAPTAKKHLAVPFRAAGTPSERSEFAQPDVAVVLTHLSYYRDGLSEGDLLDALQKLLKMLLTKACGLLTLGPSTCKDKLMQAAGRLRLLGRGQTLHLAASSEVTAKIQSCSGGMGQQQQQEWSRQGLFFAASKGWPKRVPQDERMELSAMYGASSSTQPVADVVQAQARAALVAMAGVSQQQEQVPSVAASVPASAATAAGLLASRMDAFVEQIVAVSQEHGEGHSTVALVADEECERELEQEEEEEEVERQMPKLTPVMESDWDYASALSARTPTELPSSAGVTTLAAGLIAKLHGAVAMQSVSWPAALYATANFMRAVAGGEGAQVVPKLTAEQLPSVVTLQLFDGDTRFRTAAQKRALHVLVRQRLSAAEELTGMRGKHMLLPRSDLEAACEDDLFLE